MKEGLVNGRRAVVANDPSRKPPSQAAALFTKFPARRSQLVGIASLRPVFRLTRDSGKLIAEPLGAAFENEFRAVATRQRIRRSNGGEVSRGVYTGNRWDVHIPAPAAGAS